MFKEVLDSMNNFEFKSKKAIDCGASKDMQHQVYDFDYEGLDLNVLESFCEGSFVLSSKIKFERRYVHDLDEKPMYTLYTRISNVANPQHIGQVGIFHGVAQCSDSFFETAI